MVFIPVCLTASALLCGCETYRIEYHERPAFYQKASATKLPDRVTLEDGTLIVYNQKDAKGLAEDVGEEFKIRESDDDGNVTLRAMLPEHVLSNTLTCIKNREYELLWDQIVSERTKLAYEAQGEGYEEFAAYMQEKPPRIGAITDADGYGHPEAGGHPVEL